MKKLITTKMISPDGVDIPEWNIHYHYPQQSIVGIYNDGKLYLSTRPHPSMWGRVGSHFDFRIIQSGELIWGGTDYPGKYIKKIKGLIDNKQYQSFEQIPEFKFTAILLNEPDGIVRYELDEIEQFCPNVIDNSYLRICHLMSPRFKKKLISKKQSFAEYKESCRYGNKRIGDIDVAEGHLLMYEE